MKKLIVGIFDSITAADNSVNDLEAMGYKSKDITVITREDVVSGEISIENDTSKGIEKGTKRGGIAGGVLGMLFGLGALTIPSIGSLFITGPVAILLGVTGVVGSTASGALTGALAGGLVSALKEIGIDEIRARRYEDAIKGGSILLGVSPREGDDPEVENVLGRYGADDITVFELNHAA